MGGVGKERGPAPWIHAAALAACGIYLAVEAYLLSFDFGFPLDDSWIHLQFARNLAAGNGLSYNPGELVTGSTAPLWTALLSLVFLVPGNPVLWAKALGALFHVAAVDATFRLARELGVGRRLATVAAALCLATGWLVWSALAGMEVPLFATLSLWGMTLHLRERRDPSRPPLALGVLGAAALARPEGVVLLALAVVDSVVRIERSAGAPPAAGALGSDAAPLGASGGPAEADPPEPARRGGWSWRPPSPGRLVRGLLPVLLLLLPVALFYRWAGGTAAPTTLAAKSVEVRRLLPEPEYLATVARLFAASHPWMLVASVLGAGALAARAGRAEDRGLLPALWLLALPFAYGLASPGHPHHLMGNFGRYYFPLFPVLIALGALGLERLGARTPDRLRPRSRTAQAFLLAVLFLPTLGAFTGGALTYARNVANVQDSDVKAARWLGPRLPPEALLAVNDIGALKYLLPNPVLDLAGIVHPEVRVRLREAQARGEDWQEAIGRFLEERRPDYLVVFPSWFPSLLAPGSPFEPLYVLPIPNNITMGGPEIVIFSTPWTRYPLREPPSRPVAPG